ncbi:hypothetical protein BDV25DRAFT_131055 [Aspergillus avenaceus]|uniref:T6SS Phospholipase effector Tle1-like catalytic domain-containing protein n=1 Tax=Aspergillus avenaceus TaxID=36643 RepID=A0A5N6TQJ7_ASPAV|nr:hypothetical protein BDV25DRAFT_131055 [Aspergillus avenaceus]
MTSRPSGKVETKTFVLCFDGTGNKFKGDPSDSNVLKVFRMLDRNDYNQYHYYQPGIGTYVTSASLEQDSRIQKIKSAYLKAKDSAVGSTLADHVMGGYKFLMRYYCPGDRIYFFGFSRGAYVARFLAEMLDNIGLLEAGNEELIRFTWKTFAKWQQRGGDTVEKEKLAKYMMAFRETFCHPVSPLRFLGLFDSVNSVPRFEQAWMQRSDFPYTSRTSAKVIRHAVSIDERRAKFRQDLISEVKPTASSRRHRFRDHLERVGISLPHHPIHHHRHEHRKSVGNAEASESKDKAHPCAAYRPTRRPQSHNPQLDSAVGSMQDGRSTQCSSVTNDPSFDEDEDTPQDIEEVWFPGCHADIGGGWKLDKDGCALSHAPLVWMVHKAQGAGLKFDEDKLKHFNCVDDILDALPESPQAASDSEVDHVDHALHEPQPPSRKSSTDSEFQYMLRRSSTDGRIHDCLQFRNGIGWTSVLSWKLMEYLPFRRMDLQDDGTWKPIRWPLPCGEVRDIPNDAKIHISAINRMMENPDYRPGNLILGGGGRGKRRAPKECGIGEWDVAGYQGSPIAETYLRSSGAGNSIASH